RGSALEEAPVGAVRTVDLAVAIEAGAAGNLVARRGARLQGELVACRTWSDRVLARVLAVVALLAEPGRARRQERRQVGAVRRVAVRAALDGRLVLPQIRAALVRVAGPAGLVDGVLLHHARAGRAVRVVAIGARHLALADRVVGDLQRVGALLPVAGEAHLGLRLLLAHPVMGSVHLVAIAASHVVHLVSAALPMRARGALVAADAGFVPLGDRC